MGRFYVFFLMWAGKWQVGSLVTGENLIADAMGQAAVRSGIGDFSYAGLVLRQINVPDKRFIAAGLLCLTGCICLRLANKSLQIQAENIVICPEVAVIPFLWYAVFRQYSYIQAFIIYREMAVTVYAAWMLGVHGFECSTGLE